MRSLRTLAVGGALAAATIAGAAAGATFLGTANAATGSSASTTADQTQPADPQAHPAGPAHGTPEHEGQERPVTGDAATKAQAAAVASVGSGTAGEVTTDLPGTGYEVTVTKADGSQVEVHLDSSLAVMQGHGGPGGPGGPGGHRGPRPNDNDADDQPAASTPSTTTTP